MTFRTTRHPAKRLRSVGAGAAEGTLGRRRNSRVG